MGQGIGEILTFVGMVFLLFAARNWRHRPAPGAQPEMPKWMAGVDAQEPGKALGCGLAGVSPKTPSWRCCSWSSASTSSPRACYR